MTMRFESIYKFDKIVSIKSSIIIYTLYILYYSIPVLKMIYFLSIGHTLFFMMHYASNTDIMRYYLFKHSEYFNKIVG